MKRGSSGLSLVVAVYKPTGMTSHDVVNRCRKIFGEKRVGHTGTLDPLASGVLPICVGPATRLDRYLTSDEKRYRVTLRLGQETTTDDAEGDVVRRGELAPDLLDGTFAAAYISGLVGRHMQIPPRYSAIKVKGKKAYEIARKGGDPDLKPRPIEVFEAVLVSRHQENESVLWVIDFSVSKGTYIRALVRDIGRELGCFAHVTALERVRSGCIELSDCVSLESLEVLKQQAAIDPARLLGLKLAFADDSARLVESGARLRPEQIRLYEFKHHSADYELCSCMGSVRQCCKDVVDSELVSVIVENKLKALYRFDSALGMYLAECVFSTGVSRG